MISKNKIAASAAAVLLLTATTLAFAEESKERGNHPLPLQGIEGYGGLFSTYTAYLENMPPEGQLFGLPSIGGTYVHMGKGRALEGFMLTETISDRLELSYAYDSFDTGELGQYVERATGVQLSDTVVGLHNLNARLAVIQENQFGSWMPAVTLGVHYKYNDTVDDMDDDLGGALSGIGVEGNEGVEFTAYATKLFTFLPRPLLVDLGLRVSKAAHIGLLGFTDEYKPTFEGNVAYFAFDNIAFAAEYRMKPDEYGSIPGLVGPEDDWWTLDIAFIITKHMTIEGGYAHFGSVLTDDANHSWGIKTHYEF